MGQLTDEENVSYDTGATPLTPTAIITALLALQERTPAITVGTIEPTTTFCIAVENVTLMKAVSECVSYIGGYIEVDEDRHFNWYNEPSGSPTREIRYQKNMAGVTRKRDFTSITNKLYAYGYGETEAQVTLIDAGETYEYIEDATSQTAYGVHPRRITDKRITHPSTLLAWAQKVLAEYKDPIYSYTVDAVNLAVHPDHTFDLENLEVGQIVRVVNSDLTDPLTGLGLNVNVKIVKVTTNLSDPKDISLELANATKSLADLISSSADTSSIVNNIAVQIGAGQVTVMGTFTVDGWRTTGQTTIDGGNITANTITCDRLTTSALDDEIAISSSNFVAGSAGFQIKGDGSAEFSNVVVRGTIGASTIQSEANITVAGYLYSNNYTFAGGAITAGWFIDGYNGSIQAKGIVVFAGGVSCYGGTISTDNYGQISVPKITLRYASSKFSEFTISSDGLHLYWKDDGGTTHTLV